MRKKFTILIAALVIFMSAFTIAKAETTPGLKPVLKTPSLSAYGCYTYILNENEYMLFGNTPYNGGEFKNLIKGGLDIVILKYNKDKLQWVKTFGGSEDESLKDVIACDNGNFIVFGTTNSNDKDLLNMGNGEKVLFSIDRNGNIKWKKVFPNYDCSNIVLGKNSFYYEYYKDGNIIREKYDFEGNKVFEIKDQSTEEDCYYNTILSASDYEGFYVNNNNNLIKYNDKGEKEWIAQKWTLGSDDENPEVYGIRGILETTDKGFIAKIGYIEGSPDFIGFVKYNNKGIIEWEVKNDFSDYFKVDEEKDKYIVTSGRKIVEYSKDGKKIREYELNDGQNNIELSDVLYTNDSGFLACGSLPMFGTDSKEKAKGVVEKFDENGKKIWTKFYDSNNILNFSSIIYLDDKNIFILGENILSGTDYENIVLFKLDSSYANVSSVKLNVTSKTLKKGQSIKLSAVISPNNASNKTLIWTSSNAKVAKVDSTGKVTAVGKGTAIITVKSVDGEYTSQCKITVK